MEGTDIKKMCQMKLLTFAEWQSSENFLLSGLFIMAKGWDHFPRDRKKLLLYKSSNFFFQVAMGKEEIMTRFPLDVHLNSS